MLISLSFKGTVSTSWCEIILFCFLKIAWYMNLSKGKMETVEFYWLRPSGSSNLPMLAGWIGKVEDL